jgi:phospholipid/cholesterol/gamma-HCH transport system substrate-binding protein
MKRPRVLINLAIFGTLFLLMLIEATRSIVSVGAISHPYSLNAEFPDSIGVFAHSEVDYLGVSIGEVASVSRVPGGVRVHMSIGKNHKVPAGSSANLARKSAIGEQYVDFEPPPSYTGNHGPYYAAGYTVPVKATSPQSGDTTIPLQFDELLRSAANLLNSIPPDSLATVVHEAAIGLNGRSDSLRALAESGDQLSSALVSKTQALNQLITTGTRLTHTVTDHRTSLGQSLADLSQVAATLQQAQGDTSRLLDKGDPFLQQTADIVANQKANLDCDLKYVTNLIDLTSRPRKLQELTALLDFGPIAFDNIMKTIDWTGQPSGTGPEWNGPWARVGLILNGENKATQYYPPPKQAPPPPQVPGCSSSLKPVVANYRPATASLTAARPGHGLPGAAGEGVLMLCFGLLVAASLSWRALSRPGDVK